MANLVQQRLEKVLDVWPEVRQAAMRAVAELGPQVGHDLVWPRIAKVLSPALPLDCHRAAHDAVFADWDVAHLGPRPVWFPDADALANSNAARLCREHGWSGWPALHHASVDDRNAFWSTLIDRLSIIFEQPPTAICAEPCDPTRPAWLPGARLNIAESCFGLNKATPAIRWGKADGTIEEWSIDRLDEMSASVAAGLAGVGLHPGDAVAIDMPMTPLSVAIYLGIVRAGMAVVSIADSFSPPEIAMRLRIAKAKLVITQDVFRRAGKELPLYAKVADAGAERCVVAPAGDWIGVELRDGDLTFDQFAREPNRIYVAADPAETINVLFSSGTTGDPKAIPWDHTTPIKCAVDGQLHLDIRPGDVVCWPTSLGWMMGPWLIFAALLNKATIALYEDIPLGPRFARFVERAKVTMLGVVPSLVKRWRSTDCLAGVDWRGIRCFGSTGECSNANDYFWLSGQAGYRPVIEYCGGTEIGGAYITGSLLQPQSPATFSTPAVGLDLVLLNDGGEPADAGEVFLMGPSIGLSRHLLNREHNEVYFADVPTLEEGRLLRRHGDQLTRLPHGYYRAEGRCDDTMNLGGIKVSSAEIERIVVRATGVKEAAAVAVPPNGGGPDELVLFVVPQSNVTLDADALLAESRQLLARELNPLFHPSRIELLDDLPRTASNKVLRRQLRERARG